MYWQGEREQASYDLDIANKQFANNNYLIHFS